MFNILLAWHPSTCNTFHSSGTSAKTKTIICPGTKGSLIRRQMALSQGRHSKVQAQIELASAFGVLAVHNCMRTAHKACKLTHCIQDRSYAPHTHTHTHTHTHKHTEHTQTHRAHTNTDTRVEGASQNAQQAARAFPGHR